MGYNERGKHMKNLYIDFDGVILDTEDLLFEDWRKIPNHKNLSEEEKIKYIQNIDWNFPLYIQLLDIYRD